MKATPIILKILSGLFSAAGGLLLFWAILRSGPPDIPLLSIGLLLMSLGEALSIYGLQFESPEMLHLLKSRLWQDLGANWAFPLLLLLFSSGAGGVFARAILLSAFVFALLRSASLVIKVYMVDKSIR